VGRFSFVRHRKSPTGKEANPVRLGKYQLIFHVNNITCAVCNIVQRCAKNIKNIKNITNAS
jgi:hypothetical protein